MTGLALFLLGLNIGLSVTAIVNLWVVRRLRAIAASLPPTVVPLRAKDRHPEGRGFYGPSKPTGFQGRPL